MFPPPWSNFKRSIHTRTSLQVITDQLKENIIQWWIIYAIRSFFQIDFRFKYQLINLLWLSFDFFSFSWSVTICFFMALNSCVCSWAKISRNVLYLQLFTFLVLILQSTYFICATWKLKQTMEQQPHHACDRTKSKHKNKVSSRVLLFDIAHKQCNGIFKGWLHYLTS